MIKKLANKLSKRSSSGGMKKTTAKASKTASRSTSSKFSEQEVFSMIEKKAYEIFEKRGFTHGDDQHDWFMAEKAVRASLKK